MLRRRAPAVLLGPTVGRSVGRQRRATARSGQGDEAAERAIVRSNGDDGDDREERCACRQLSQRAGGMEVGQSEGRVRSQWKLGRWLEDRAGQGRASKRERARLGEDKVVGARGEWAREVSGSVRWLCGRTGAAGRGGPDAAA